MKSIKKALCSVLVCFGAAMFLSSTAYASEGTEVAATETADNNFVDNNVTEENVTINNAPVDNYLVNAVTETAMPEAVASAVPVAAVPEAVASAVPVTDIQSETDETADAETVTEKVVAGGKKVKKQSKTKKYNKADLRLMSAIIYCEAGSEPYAGKVAVGIVVMNRVKSKSFPNTIKKVIYQKSQFSPVRNGSLNRALARYDSGKFNSKLEKQCIKAAKEALDGVKSVKYAGSTKNMKSFHYFSGSLRGARYKIKGHRFK